MRRLPCFVAIVPLVMLWALLASPASARHSSSATPPPSLSNAAACPQHLFHGMPKATRPSSRFKPLCNDGYAVGYSEARKDPLWAAYHLTWVEHPAHLQRPAKFSVDPRTEAKVRHEDYTQQPPRLYDRGHMAPNFAVGSRYGQEAQLQTFLMSNICPQAYRLNEQTWQYLEQVIAGTWSSRHDDLWVVTGPIFDAEPDAPNAERLNGVAQIPAAFFTIVAEEHGGKVHLLAVVMDQGVKGTHVLKEFTRTVREIEEQTGLDFFSELPDDVESAVESAQPDPEWNVGQTLGKSGRGED